MADFFNHGIRKKSLYLMHFQDNRFLSHVERFFYLKKKGLKKKKMSGVTILIVFPLYSRTGLRTAPSVAHLDSLGIAPLGLFSAQYENKLKTLYQAQRMRRFPLWGEGMQDPISFGGLRGRRS
jgi:hypothetical protein